MTKEEIIKQFKELKELEPVKYDVHLAHAISSINYSERKDDIDKLDIDPHLLMVIQYYKGFGFKAINSPLRGRNLKRDSLKFATIGAELMEEGLSHFESYSNKTVYRQEAGTNKERENKLKWYKSKIGQIVQQPMLLSVSQDKVLVDRSDRVVFSIITSSDTKAHDISRFADIMRDNGDYEKECIFKRDAIFKIVSVEDNQVVLEECYNFVADHVLLDDFWNLEEE